MIGFPYTYGDELKSGNGFTSEVLINNVSEYWTPENQRIFLNSYTRTLSFLSLTGVLLSSTSARAQDGFVDPPPPVSQPDLPFNNNNTLLLPSPTDPPPYTGVFVPTKPRICNATNITITTISTRTLMMRNGLLIAAGVGCAVITVVGFRSMYLTMKAKMEM